ncbi:MAG: L,D-transpeptidase [Rhodobacteraceae bacterium]|nr:L,D-transpeptidase [Paracoccaceae bacterium]
MSERVSRRKFTTAALATLGTALTSGGALSAPRSTHVVASYTRQYWQEYFPDLSHGAILVEVRYKTLHFWSKSGFDYRVYPTSSPISSDLTRLGRTHIIRKVVGPSWRPTPAMRERNPEWPEFMPPGPDNPLGTHALYLTWQYYRIHGTHDDLKIGRRSSNGCIGLFNDHIAELYDLTEIGTQVLLI